MATVNFTSDVLSISGKLCSKEGVVYSVNKQTGKTYRSDRHGYHDANTEAQQQTRKLFATKGSFSAACWRRLIGWQRHNPRWRRACRRRRR